ncbi:MAG: type II toxin-antitoxin system RelE/ParE family toxin [Candidatus Cloacimonadales bacterium]|nr:type II toxin-antitoxin system RelE/ParE family toxin [Candidatus Cloacimonadales bacterium]
MAKYEIKFNTSVKKDFRRIPNKDVLKILDLINSLADDPYSGNVKKLSQLDKYRIRYRNYRIVYRIVKNELIICIIKIADRKDAYKFLK